MTERRTYYDHESAYSQVLAEGGTGWDDFCKNPAADSYTALETFLAWPGLERIVGGSALELGCGGGQGALLAAQRGFRVVGIDFAPSAVALARANAERLGLDAAFSEGDCLTLSDVADQSVDLVIDNHVLHCIVRPGDRAAFLASAARVLKPGGLFFSETMSCEGSFNAAVVKADPETRVAYSDTRFWVSADELEHEYAKAGFGILFSGRREDTSGAGDTLVTYAARGAR